MSSAPTPQEIARDATWLAQALDPAAGQVRLIAMDRDSYRAASFLDDRMLQQPVDAQIVPWPDVEEAVSDDLRNDARWIFHIGHVGSTLVSRLLGELDGVLAFASRGCCATSRCARPRSGNAISRPVPKLMSRTFAANEIACVKATSFVSEIAAELVPPGERALFMYATPAQLHREHPRRREQREGAADARRDPGAAPAARVPRIGRARPMPDSPPSPGRAR